MHDDAGNKLKVPHMGWNEVHQAVPHPLWAGIADGARFYFVHSYYRASRLSPSWSPVYRITPFAFTCAVATR